MQSDLFGLLGADLRQQPIDNQLAVDLVFVHRNVHELTPVMDLDLPVAIRKIATLTSVLHAPEVPVRLLQVGDFPVRQVRRVIQEVENLIGA